MRNPRDNPEARAGRSPRDTLDDEDRNQDAVHELTDLDPFSEAPTAHYAGSRDLATQRIDSRELPTGPAEHRTAPWMHATPWQNPNAPPERKTDPWFWPVVVFVFVLLTCIGVFIFEETHKVH